MHDSRSRRRPRFFFWNLLTYHLIFLNNRLFKLFKFKFEKYFKFSSLITDLDITTCKCTASASKQSVHKNIDEMSPMSQKKITRD